MPFRSRLFSLSALTKAYQRNLKVFAQATGTSPSPAGRKARAGVLEAGGRLLKAAGAAEKARRKVVRAPGAQGEWQAGIAPGPAGARRYQLYVPVGLGGARTLSSDPSDASVPLLVMLHGCDQTGRGFADVTRMNRLAAREGFLVLYPEQERVANGHGCWNWFERRSGKAEAEAATLLAAVDLVARKYPVDLERVAVAGLSAGASMAALMAGRYPHRFCAVAMHSGVAPGSAESAATATAAMHGRRQAHLPDLPQPLAAQGAVSVPLPPLLILHGDADPVVSVRNAAATAELWAEALGAHAGSARTVQRGKRHAVRVTEYKGRGRNPVTQVTLREILGLDHAWSGGAPGLQYSDPAGPDASALVWAFVAQQFKKV